MNRSTRWRRRLRVRFWMLAGITAVTLLVAAISVGTAQAAAPTNRSQPTIQGRFQVGETLTATTGQWNNNPTQFAYRWQRCDQQGTGCANISGATAKTYKLTSDDVDHTVRLIVTGSNRDGQNAANSTPSPLISGNEAPRNTIRPKITGTAMVGEELKADIGTWTGGAQSFTYQWQRCDENGDNCADVQGATSQSYGVRSADIGHTMRVEVSAKNAAGVTTVNTDRSLLIKAAAQPQPQPQPSTGGCQKLAAGVTALSVDNVLPPARLLVDKMQFMPNVITRSTKQLTLRLHISDTCGRSVQGALVYVTGVPFNQTAVMEQPTGLDGWVQMTLPLLRGFPAASHQQLLALFVRARGPSGDSLAGISTRRLISVRVNLAA